MVGVFFDFWGSLSQIDSYNNAVRLINVSTGGVTSPALIGPALNTPTGVAMDSTMSIALVVSWNTH